MLSVCDVNKRWREKMMGGGYDGLKTIECLRGRLLAEREASKVAKENAEFIGIELIELEEQLSEESKLRNKAEKKLKLLMRKLEALKLSSVSDQFSSSDTTEDSCNSFTASSGLNDPEKQEPGFQTLDSTREVKDPVST